MAVDIFLEISIIVILATFFAGIMRILRQPLIIGYILTGLAISPFFLNLTSSSNTIQTFSHIGIALLLFLVGLGLNLRMLKDVG
ncbi:MAG: cation:proton antiporter, partial [archaeon]